MSEVLLGNIFYVKYLTVLVISHQATQVYEEVAQIPAGYFII